MPENLVQQQPDATEVSAQVQAERFWLRRIKTQADIDPKALERLDAPHDTP
jgi:hypothetical protein